MYFGLLAPPEEDLSRPETRAVRPHATDAPDSRGGAVRNALGYFGLIDHPDHRPSRYGDHVRRELDREIDALHARIAELERRLDERER